MVDRTIINWTFTLYRHQGASFCGRLFETTLAYFTYHLLLLTGTERGAVTKDYNDLT